MFLKKSLEVNWNFWWGVAFGQGASGNTAFQSVFLQFLPFCDILFPFFTVLLLLSDYTMLLNIQLDIQGTGQHNCIIIIEAKQTGKKLLFVSVEPCVVTAYNSKDIIISGKREEWFPLNNCWLTECNLSATVILPTQVSFLNCPFKMRCQLHSVGQICEFPEPVACLLIK